MIFLFRYVYVHNADFYPFMLLIWGRRILNKNQRFSSHYSYRNISDTFLIFSAHTNTTTTCVQILLDIIWRNEKSECGVWFQFRYILDFEAWRFFKWEKAVHQVNFILVGIMQTKESLSKVSDMGPCHQIHLKIIFRTRIDNILENKIKRTIIPLHLPLNTKRMSICLPMREGMPPRTSLMRMGGEDTYHLYKFKAETKLFLVNVICCSHLVIFTTFRCNF